MPTGWSNDTQIIIDRLKTRVYTDFCKNCPDVVNGTCRYVFAEALAIQLSGWAKKDFVCGYNAERLVYGK